MPPPSHSLPSLPPHPYSCHSRPETGAISPPAFIDSHSLVKSQDRDAKKVATQGGSNWHQFTTAQTTRFFIMTLFLVFSLSLSLSIDKRNKVTICSIFPVRAWSPHLCINNLQLYFPKKIQTQLVHKNIS